MGILSLIVGVNKALKFGGMTIHGIIANESGLSDGSMYAAMTVGMILSIGELVLANLMQIESFRPALDFWFFARMKSGEDIMMSRMYANELKKKRS